MEKSAEDIRRETMRMDEDEVVIYGTTYRFGIVSNRLREVPKYFASRTSTAFLHVSQDVPREWRRAVASHAVYRVQQAQMHRGMYKHHAIIAAAYEVNHIDPASLGRYALFRIECIDEHVLFLANRPDAELSAELDRLRLWWQQLI